MPKKFENLALKIAKEYQAKGKSKSKSLSIGYATAAKVFREKMMNKKRR